MNFDIHFFRLQGIFGDEGRTTIQVIIRTVMSIKVCMILEILPNSFEMAKGILKDHMDSHMGVKGFLSFSTKEKKNNTK